MFFYTSYQYFQILAVEVVSVIFSYLINRFIRLIERMMLEGNHIASDLSVL
jgi:hypothetical protein